MQTGTVFELKEEVCGQVNQEICRAGLSENKNSWFWNISAEEKNHRGECWVLEPDEHHASEKDYVLSPALEELSDEQSDDDYLFKDILDTDFWM